MHYSYVSACPLFYPFNWHPNGSFYVKTLKTIGFLQSKPCSLVLGCLAMFNYILSRGLCNKAGSMGVQGLLNQSRVVVF